MMSDQLQHDDEENLFPDAEPLESEEPEAEVPETAFEDLTMAQAVERLWRKPISTMRAFIAVAQTPSFVPQHQARSPSIFAPAMPRPVPAWKMPMARPSILPDTQPVETPASHE